MEQITKYKAEDGTEFTDEKKCLNYEADCQVVERIIIRLQPLPKDDGCLFANGAGFIQHDRETFLSVRRELLQQAIRELPGVPWLQDSLDNYEKHPSWAQRAIDDGGGTKALQKAWLRIYSTDNFFREWGQPYYAARPDRAKHFLIMP